VESKADRLRGHRRICPWGIPLGHPR